MRRPALEADSERAATLEPRPPAVASSRDRGCGGPHESTDSRRVRRLRSLVLLVLLFGLGGCSTLSYVAQAAGGQWELAAAARPIPEVIEDPATPPLTRRLLGEVESVRRFAWQNGLNVSGNYEKYVELDRDYPIWFVNASQPLAFRARLFSFPIIGSFPGLAWFDKANAERFRDSLAAKGLDVNMRGVSAFSTGASIVSSPKRQSSSCTPVSGPYLSRPTGSMRGR